MTKKRLISNIVMSVLIALSIGATFILYFMGIQNGRLFNYDLRQVMIDFFHAFKTFDNLMVFLPVVGVTAFWLLISIIWIIIDIIRRRAIVALYVIFLLCGCFLCGFYYIRLFDITAQFSSLAHLAIPFDFIVWGSTGLIIVLCLVAFIVDIVTGKRAKVEGAASEEVSEAEEEAAPVYEEIRTEEAVATAEAPVEEETIPEEEAEPEEEEEMEEEPKEKKPRKAPNKKPSSKKPSKKDDDEEGGSSARVYHVSRRADLNKWQVKMAGGDKAIKLFNTQKEAIDYAESLAKSQNGSVRVHSVAGKIRKHK